MAKRLCHGGGDGAGGRDRGGTGDPAAMRPIPVNRLSAVDSAGPPVEFAPEVADELLRRVALSEMQARHLVQRFAEISEERASNCESRDAELTPCQAVDHSTAPDCPSGTIQGESFIVDSPSLQAL